MNKLILPDNVSLIINVLRAAGYEAYAVGGCVRDCIMGGVPDDWDITTSALPEQVKGLFTKTVDTGIKHGTVTVILHGTGYEVTTYRIDGEYHDGRHPDSVSFTASLEEDLKRRDFTINAFVFNDEDGIIDMFDGLSDLKNGIIRCVGEPRARFSEDALRILRALRFAARFSFTIDPATLEAAREIGPNLKKVSAERIRTELDKLLLSDNPDYISLLHELDLDKIVLPQMCQISPRQMDEMKKALREAEPVRSIRWAILCFYLAEAACRCSQQTDFTSEQYSAEYAETTNRILRQLKFDNKTIDTVTLFVKHAVRQLPIPCTSAQVSCPAASGSDSVASGSDSAVSVSGSASDSRYETRLLIHDIGWENLDAFLEFRRSLSPSADIEGLKHICDDIFAGHECTCMKELDINGRILIDSGYAPGTGIGIILDGLLDAALKDPTVNSLDKLLKMAEEFSDK